MASLHLNEYRLLHRLLLSKALVVLPVPVLAVQKVHLKCYGKEDQSHLESLSFPELKKVLKLEYAFQDLMSVIREKIADVFRIEARHSCTELQMCADRSPKYIKMLLCRNNAEQPSAEELQGCSLSCAVQDLGSTHSTMAF